MNFRMQKRKYNYYITGVMPCIVCLFCYKSISNPHNYFIIEFEVRNTLTPLYFLFQIKWIYIYMIFLIILHFISKKIKEEDKSKYVVFLHGTSTTNQTSYRFRDTHITYWNLFFFPLVVESNFGFTVFINSLTNGI